MTDAVQAQETAVPGSLALAAMKNAQRLLDDAELLLSRGRWPTAYSVAVLALEEAGKAWGCVQIMLAPDHVRSKFYSVTDLTRGYASHILKLLIAHGTMSLLAFIRGAEDAPDSILVPVAELAPLVVAANDAKQRGLYADYRDGTVWDPASIGKDEATRTVRGVREALYYGAALTDPGFIAFLAELPADAIPVVDELWARLWPAIQDDDEEAGARAMRQWLDEMNAVGELREILPAEAARLAAERAQAARRSQPRRSPRKKRRRRKH